MSTDKKSVDWYNEHTAEYTAHVRNPEESVFHSLYEKPAMYSLLPDLNGASAISLGCGSGEDCAYLARQGATHVTGIDISIGMIDEAHKTYPTYDFSVMDMEALDFDDGSFDFAYSSLALHYIEDWTKVMSEVYRVLKPGASFLFSCNHPLYSAMEIVENTDTLKRKELSRTIDKHTNTSIIVGDYVTRKAIGQQGDGDMGVTTWHKSIGEIAAEATAAGFMIQAICEPQPLEKMKILAPKDYATLIRIPNFIIFKLYKSS